jgi:anti-anti-sigma factor
MPEHFDCDVEQAGSTLTLHVTGEFDLVGVGPVESALDPLPPGVDRVVFDLSALEFLDASGLGTVMRAHDRGRAEGFEVVVVRPRGIANRVFTVTRTDQRLTMVDRVPAVPAPR